MKADHQQFLRYLNLKFDMWFFAIFYEIDLSDYWTDFKREIIHKILRGFLDERRFFETVLWKYGVIFCPIFHLLNKLPQHFKFYLSINLTSYLQKYQIKIDSWEKNQRSEENNLWKYQRLIYCSRNMTKTGF